jgi:hypothetical protein
VKIITPFYVSCPSMGPTTPRVPYYEHRVRAQTSCSHWPDTKEMVFWYYGRIFLDRRFVKLGFKAVLLEALN